MGVEPILLGHHLQADRYPVTQPPEPQAMTPEIQQAIAEIENVALVIEGYRDACRHGQQVFHANDFGRDDERLRDAVLAIRRALPQERVTQEVSEIAMAAAARGFAITVSMAMERDGKAEADDAVVIEALKAVRHIFAPALSGLPLVSVSPSEEAVESLAKFALWAVDQIRQGFNVDSFDVQDKAVEFGVLVGVQVTERCGESCNCEEYHGDFEGGVTCYRDSPTLAAYRAQFGSSAPPKEGTP